MKAAASSDFLDKNQLSNRKQYFVDHFKDLSPIPFVSSTNLLVQAAVAPNSNW